jgi:hypothetical protein
LQPASSVISIRAGSLTSPGSKTRLTVPSFD